MGEPAQQSRLGGAPGAHLARAYAHHLLSSLGVRTTRTLDLLDEHAALSWARSGLMSLTGARDGEARMCPAPIAACADGALAALAVLAPAGLLSDLRGSQLLAERAALTGHTRNGAISPGGSCRLLASGDGVIALNLARDEDWILLAAWLEKDGVSDWDAVARVVRERPAAALVARGREIGLALAEGAALPRRRAARALFTPRAGALRSRELDRKLRVVDLSSLWAGPLCGHLLLRAGCEVIKVESLGRPDGARRGPAAFFDLLNAGKASVALDFTDASQRAQLIDLLRGADIVIESARPRALRQLGIEADAILRDNPRLSWVSITAYGRELPQGQWAGYGDDTAVAAGLSALMHEAIGEDLIVGDAIADPLTGIHAAVAALADQRSGGGSLISVALRDVVAQCIDFDRPFDAAARCAEWLDVVRRARVPAQAPRPRTPAGLARPLGADAGILAKTL